VHESDDGLLHGWQMPATSSLLPGRSEVVQALDPATGAVHWQYDPPQRIWERAYATDGQLILIGTEGGQLVALDNETGDEIWQADLGIDTQVPPFIAGEVVYVPTTFVGPGLDSNPDGKAKVYALNIADGTELWQFESDNDILQSPFLRGDTLYVGGMFTDPAPVDEGATPASTHFPLRMDLNFGLMNHSTAILSSSMPQMKLSRSSPM